MVEKSIHIRFSMQNINQSELGIIKDSNKMMREQMAKFWRTMWPIEPSITRLDWSKGFLIHLKGLKHKLIYKYSDLTGEKIRLIKAHFDQSKSPKPYFSPWLRISHLIVVSYRNHHLSKTLLFSLICMWFSTDWFWGPGSQKIREKVPLAGSQNTNDETL